ncbi:NAD(P)/FAD-dependent oxidoreductase [Acinetobacter pragensis]|uniref:NAD(P)/FAD-dependent oxidoreductase n=1 Tax=Acinetobacter pragensis TaxID=1806892 RepID=UPI00333F09E3
MTKRVVIIGGGHAGCSCAKALRHEQFNGEIVLISNESELPYHRPPLSKSFIKDETEMEFSKLSLQPENFYEKYNIDLRLDTAVSEIDPDDQLVKLYHGDMLHYDYLVLATGTRPRQLPLPGLELDGVMSLRTLQDARKLRLAMQKVQNTVIIGGGFIGLELASTARAMSKNVTVLEHTPRVLGRSVAPLVSDYIADMHRANGIQIETGVFINEFVGENGQVTGVKCQHGIVPAELVLVGVGAIPNTELADQAGLQCENGIVVNHSMQTNHANIFAIGDCANHQNAFAGERRIRLESVQNANDQALTVAKMILSNNAEQIEYKSVPWFWTDQGDVRLQMTGLSFDTSDYVIRGDLKSGRFSVFHYAKDKLVAIDSVNQPVDHMVARKLLEAGITPSKIQAADMNTNLKSLLAV